MIKMDKVTIRIGDLNKTQLVRTNYTKSIPKKKKKKAELFFRLTSMIQ